MCFPAWTHPQIALVVSMDFVAVTCPYCFESMELEIEADESGEMVQDCEVCCQPWLLVVTRDPRGVLRVRVDRAQ